MNTIDVKEQVRKALQTEWPVFAEAHPRLAAVVDETLLVDSVASSLAEDPEYTQAMATADEIGAGAEIASDIISRIVSQWLRRLFLP